MLPDSMISVTELWKSFGAFPALRGIDLEISRGERVVICGPSGSGKSTLIRCFNALERRSSGRIVVAGVELNDDARNIRAVRRLTAMVFQNFALFPHLTVLENLTFAPVSVLRLSRVEAEERALVYLDRVRMAGFAARYPGQLSGGQQQRVAIARALTMEPEILLFDEPTSSLDPEMIKEVLDTMVEIAREGRTMVVVTHEMGFARAVADRIIFMDAGKILEQARPDTFFVAPAQERTRQFLSQILDH